MQSHKISNHKTKLCKYWNLGSCKNQEFCKYAHGVDELKHVYIEDVEEVKRDDFSKKTPICKYWLKGVCKFKEKCRFLHEKNGSEVISKNYKSIFKKHENFKISSTTFKKIDDSHSTKPNIHLYSSDDDDVSLSELDDCPYSHYFDSDIDHDGIHSDYDYGPKYMNPCDDIGHAYGKYGFGGEEWFDYLDANGIDPNSD